MPWPKEELKEQKSTNYPRWTNNHNERRRVTFLLVPFNMEKKAGREEKGGPQGNANKVRTPIEVYGIKK